MNNNIITILSILLCLSAMSCDREKKTKIDIPFEGEKLVVYGLIGNDQPPQLEIYHTQHSLDKSVGIFIEDTENVEAVLKENGIEQDSFLFDEGLENWFASSISAIQEDDYYEVFVKYKDLSVLSESVQLPEKIFIDSLNYQVSLDSEIITIQLFFSDPSVDENFFYAEIIQKKNDTIVNPQLPKFWLMTSDKEIMDFPKYLFVEENLDTSGVDKIIVKFYHLSSAFNSFYKIIFENDTNLGNQYSNQLPPWTNMMGGYGFVGTYQVDSIKIEL